MTQARDRIVVAEILEIDIELSLTEICLACGVEEEAVVELVEEGFLEPVGTDEAQWRFPGASLQRTRRALRLQQDLGVNVAGAALALELLDELRRLKSELATYTGDQS